MAELRYNNQAGTLGASLTSSGTTITFAVAPNFATLSGGNYIKLVLDNGTGSFEIVYLTAYTAAATTGTITREAEDPTNWPATTHSSGTGTWSCTPTVQDFPGGLTAAPWLDHVSYCLSGADFYTVNDGTFAALDTTNLTTLFVVPPSGQVLLRASFPGQVTSDTTPGDTTTLFATFLDHTSGDQVSQGQIVAQSECQVATIETFWTGRFLYEATVTTLTPGSALQYDLAAMYEGAGSASIYYTTFQDYGGVELFVYPA